MELTNFHAEELLDEQELVKMLGYHKVNTQEHTVSPRGYRILHRIPRLPPTVIENLIETFGDLSKIIFAGVEDLDEVEGIGEARAKMIKSGLTRIQEQLFVDRHI